MKRELLSINPLAGNNCFYATLHSIFDYQGCPLSEEELYFISDGLDCCYERDSREQNPLLKLHFPDYSSVLQRLSKVLSSKLMLYQTPNPNILAEAIARRIPVLLLLNPAPLRYQPLSQNYENTCHAVFVYGISDGMVAVADAFVLDQHGMVSCHADWMPWGELTSYVYGCAWFEWPDIPRWPDQFVFMKKAVLQNLRRFCSDSGALTRDARVWGRWAIQLCLTETASKCQRESSAILKLIYYLKARFFCSLNYIESITRRFKLSWTFAGRLKEIRNEWDDFAVLCLMAASACSIKNVRRYFEAGCSTLENQAGLYMEIADEIERLQGWNNETV